MTAPGLSRYPSFGLHDLTVLDPTIAHIRQGKRTPIHLTYKKGARRTAQELEEDSFTEAEAQTHNAIDFSSTHTCIGKVPSFIHSFIH